MNLDFFKRNIELFISVIAFLIGAIGALIIFTVLPYDRGGNSYLFIKVIIYVCIVIGIGFFPNKAHKLYLLLFLPFLIILGYILPRIGYFAFHQKLEGEYAMKMYTFLFVFLFPMIVFMTSIAYRLGGGRTGTTIKIGLCVVVLFLSGYFEMFWFIANNVVYGSFPNVIPHIEVIIGKNPSWGELILFTVAHIPLFVGILFLPLDKWINKLLKKTA
jgi:hypothetical protein